MKIQTSRFGELEIADSSVITFNKGIPGFEESKKYVLIPADEKGETPFFFLQSIEKEEVNFFLVDPFSYFKEYDIKLAEQMVDRLQLEDSTDAIVLTTVTVKDEIKNATTNLKAPIIINNNSQLGMQIVLDNKDYLIKQPLFQHSEIAVARQV
ncbi:flagellar assembly protein FliW [Paenisporosarcina sp. TG-14]|uniref:flagellar assembly protein FliW n=1 Tax=Paenisporosarcina sp. TG-14 TaxID=1231057 RepID=UPI00030DFA7C|nr:flagellar assembly protein FliW [Paenisporosarcina sp. TG-14]